MSDELEEEEQTLVLEDEDEEEDEEEDEDDVEEDEEEEEEEDVIRAAQFKPDSNIYTMLMALSCVAYGLGLYIVLKELYLYCDPNQFLWGAVK